MSTPLGATASSGATTAPGTTATGTAASTAATGKTSDAASALGPDAFMKLLVAQLKYQNPLAPADGQAYMTQMATFTQVEKLDQLVKSQADALQWQQRVSAEGLVGRSVSATADDVTTTGTVVGLRYGGKDGPTLELADGRTLLASAVDHVAAAGTTLPAATSTTSPPSTTTAPVTPVTPSTPSTPTDTGSTPTP